MFLTFLENVKNLTFIIFKNGCEWIDLTEVELHV